MDVDKSTLHDELDRVFDAFKYGHPATSWVRRALVHAMIDLDFVKEIKCQHSVCLYQDQPFQYERRGDPLSLDLDHIIGQRDAGLHRVENLRITHHGCNVGWRRGLPGTFLTDDVRRAIGAKTALAHADGRMSKVYTEERNRNVSRGRLRKSAIARGEEVPPITCSCGAGPFDTSHARRMHAKRLTCGGSLVW